MDPLFSIIIEVANSTTNHFRVSEEEPMPKSVNIPGRKVPQGAYSAFVPAALPPVMDWTPRLIRVLSDADRLIGRLAGEGEGCPTLTS